MSNIFSIINKYVLPILLLILTYKFLGVWVAVIVLIMIVGINVFLVRDKFYAIKAKIAYGKSNFFEFKKYYEMAIKANANDADYLLDYSYLLMLQGDFDKALELLSRINSSKFPINKCYDAQSNLAIVYWKLGDLEKGIALLEKLFSENYINTNTYGTLTYFYILNGQLEKAYDLANKAFEYNNTNSVIIENIARVNHLIGNLEKALEYYQMLNSANTKYPEAWYNYALLLMDLKRNEDALKMLEICDNLNFSALTAISKHDIATLRQKISG